RLAITPLRCSSAPYIPPPSWPPSPLSLSSYRAHRALRSFPTRRSSDLLQQVEVVPDESSPRLGAAVPRVEVLTVAGGAEARAELDRKSTRLYSSHVKISYAVFCSTKTTHTPDTESLTAGGCTRPAGG